MRMSFLAVAFLATATAFGGPVPNAVAQQAAAPAVSFMSDKDIAGLIEKAKAERKGEAPMVAEPILLLAPYKAQLEYRAAKAPAAVHEKDAELMIVLQGTGDILTDGTLVDGKRVNSANLSGPSIASGKSHNVVKGDTILIPPNTPHQVIPSGGAPIVLMTMHVPYPPENWPPKN
jgi:mannose-6-phosphate isomerase-like protein (cupin superfamily)